MQIKVMCSVPHSTLETLVYALTVLLTVGDKTPACAFTAVSGGG